MTEIFHIALPADWEAAKATGGPYAISTRGRTLADEGFIHCSRDEAQATKVINAFYSDVPDLLLLVLDPDRLGSPVRYEPVDDDVFPHIYGPIPLEAVIDVRSLPQTR